MGVKSDGTGLYEEIPIACVTAQQIKKGSKWVTVSVTQSTLTKKQYVNTCGDTFVKFMNSLGGSDRRTFSYTSAGRIVVELFSTSPDKKTRVYRQFIPKRDADDRFKGVKAMIKHAWGN